MTTRPLKILIIRLSSIGDIILTTPMVRCIKKNYPNAEITFLVKKQFSDLLSESPYIDHVVTYDSATGFKGLKLLKNKFRKDNFDQMLDIHKNLRSLYLRLFLGVRRTTFSKQIFARTILINFGINIYKNIRPVYLRYFESVKNLNVEYDGAGTEVYFPPEKHGFVSALLKEKGYRKPKPLVVICPAATYMNKKWLPERFAETAAFLVQNKDAYVIIHGGKGDESLCSGIAESAGENVISFAGTLSLHETTALLSLADLVIANDSGLLHLAQSRKVPVIGIYGSTTRELGFFPIEGTSRVVEADLSCRPCTHKGLNYCPKKHFRCMNDITVESVKNAAVTMLK